MAIDMKDLYSKDKTAVSAAATPDVQATNATAATATSRDATASRAASNTANAAQGNATSNQIDGDKMNVDSQVNRITGEDSAYMQSARQGGLMTAAARGLQNSSLAAGASQREAVRAALPMAQQNASQEFNSGMANTAAQNEMEKLNVSMSTDVNKFNADQVNAINKLNAQMETAVSTGNAEEANKIASMIAQLKTNVSMQNATEANRVGTLNADRNTSTNQFNTAEQNKQNAQTQDENATLNKQFLAGSQAADLATIQGKYNSLIANNSSASSLYTAHMQAITEIMKDDKLTPAAAATKIAVFTKVLDQGLAMLDTMNGVDLSSFGGAPPAAPGAPGAAPAPPAAYAPPPTVAGPPPPPEPVAPPYDQAQLQKLLASLGSINFP